MRPDWPWQQRHPARPTREQASSIVTDQCSRPTAITMRIVCDGSLHTEQDVLVEVLRRAGPAWVSEVGQQAAGSGSPRLWCPRCHRMASGPHGSLRAMLDVLADGGVSQISLESLQFLLDLHDR